MSPVQFRVLPPVFFTPPENWLPFGLFVRTTRLHPSRAALCPHVLRFVELAKDSTFGNDFPLSPGLKTNADNNNSPAPWLGLASAPGENLAAVAGIVLKGSTMKAAKQNTSRKISLSITLDEQESALLEKATCVAIPHHVGADAAKGKRG